ncbi:hypothetical protein ACFQZS_02570 [Mucilaginibacter calamicampi]|uniref:Outer membrane protein beta-barrel domain-containing protein n=1 Tax=Mucilaginibacter calamicampi TaxID=1302352 RepID=A0ABW2YTE5_9SPHI
MKNKFLFVCLTLLLIPGFLFAQANFRPATIVRINGEAISGLVKYEGWSKSPASVVFKKNTAEAQTESLSARDIKSFSIDGVEEYVGYTGFVSTNKNEGPEIPYTRDSTVKSVAVFLRVVSKGSNVQLLAYRDEVKTAYFVSDKNETPAELKFYRYYNNTDRIVTSAPFRQVLIGLLEKYRGADPKWFSEVGVADYNLSSLQKFIKTINNDQTQNISTAGSRFFIGASGAYKRITLSGPKDFSFQPTSIVSPVINLGYDFYSNRFVQRTILRLEASVTQVSPTINGKYSYFRYKTLLVSFKPQLLYNFVNDKKVKPFLGVGVGINIPASSSNGVTATESGVVLSNGLAIQAKGESFKALQAGETVRNPYGANNVFITPEIKAGLAFNKKFELIASGTLVSTSLIPSFKHEIYTYSIGFNYYLQSK